MNRKNFNLKPLNLSKSDGVLPKSLVSDEIVKEFETSRTRRGNNFIDFQPTHIKTIDENLINDNLRLATENKNLLQKVKKFEKTFEKEMEDRDEELNSQDKQINSLTFKTAELLNENDSLKARVNDLEEVVKALQVTNRGLTEKIKSDSSSSYWFTRYFYGSN